MSALVPELLSVHDVARRLGGLSVKTIRRMIARGDLVAHRVSKRRIVVNAESVMRLIAAQGGAAESVTRVSQSSSPVAPELDSGEVRFKVNREPGRGFIIRFYDAAGKRKSHRIGLDRVPDDSTLEVAEAYAKEWVRQSVVGGTQRKNKRRQVHTGPTFRQLATEWTDGTLAKRFPDHVRRKVSAKDDGARLRRFIFPHIGDEPVAAFEGGHGLDLVERVVVALPKELSPGSRRQVLQAVRRVLELAVYPCRLLSANPLPRGFVPTRATTRAKSFLRPSEEAQLLGCKTIPLLLRLFFGVLAREGLRVSEALKLEWRHVDLEIGVVRLDQNKTDDPRVWALSPDVAEGLRRWKRMLGRKVTASRLVFKDAAGSTIDRYEAARELRARLREAGIERDELFEESKTRIPLRAHDLRGTFVTIKLAVGRSEAWISDRTGHTTSAMIYRYKRNARSAAELGLGDFAPLHETIPELRELGSTAPASGSSA